MNTSVYFLRDLEIVYKEYTANFRLYSKKFKSYAGVIGITVPNGENISLPLIAPVAAIDNSTFSTSYFIIRKGSKSPEQVYIDSILKCSLKSLINFSFTSISSSISFGSFTTGSIQTYDNETTFNIFPDLQMYACQYYYNDTHS